MKKLLLVLTAVLSFAALSSDHDHLSCIPENNLNIPVQNKIVRENALWIPSNLKSGAVVTEAQFNKAIDDIEKIYAPIFQNEYNAKLVMVRKWDDGTVNAYANRSGKNWNVHMFGGLARHPAVTLDGFRAVVCHEVGHHIAGAPKIKRWGMTMWASNEGQSDFFATNKCLKKYFEVDSDETIRRYEEFKETDPDSLIAKKECDRSNSSLLEAASCLRGAMAGQSLAELFRVLRKLPEPLKFGSPDPGVVSKTDHKHPAPQCRLDTYFQGAVCDADKDLLPSQSDASVAYCNRKDGYTSGVRPLCWLNLADSGLD